MARDREKPACTEDLNGDRDEGREGGRVSHQLRKKKNSNDNKRVRGKDEKNPGPEGARRKGQQHSFGLGKTRRRGDTGKGGERPEQKRVRCLVVC